MSQEVRVDWKLYTGGHLGKVHVPYARADTIY
jgi:hypothetical protein